MGMPTAYVWDERCFAHDPGDYALVLKPGGFVQSYGHHIEHADVKRRFHNLVVASGLADRMVNVASRDASFAEVARVHQPEYIERVRACAAGGGGELGPGTAIAANGFDAALRSAGCGLAALDAVMRGEAARAYALTRPPGHHALPDAALGFCVFSNAAIVAEHARVAWGLDRIAIVDWDVHFGNGTQAVFAARRDVFTVSIHQERAYLLVRGEADELGEGAGHGYNMNVPLPAGCGFGAYRDAFERVIVPALEAYRPELVVVASGYDAGRLDPLGRMQLDGIAFRWMTERLADVADRHAQGRIVMTHEGGYCPASVPFFGLATLEALSGVRTDVPCPFTPMHDQVPGQPLQPHQAERIAALARHFADVRERHWT